MDEILEQTLNPHKNNIKKITTDVLDDITHRLPLEILQIKAHIKTQTFSLYSNEKVKVVAGHYDLSIRLLQRQAAANLDSYPQRGPLRATGLLFVQQLHELADNLNARFPDYTNRTFDEPSQIEPASPTEKVQCTLSADQIGIVLKAAYGAKVILGKSFRAICKAVAPHLATPWRDTISWDTIRSVSGRAEQRDKQIAVDFLQKMIVLIEDKQR